MAVGLAIASEAASAPSVADLLKVGFSVKDQTVIISDAQIMKYSG